MSIKLSKSGIKKAKQTLIEKRITKEILIQKVDCSRQPIYKFFNGKSISDDLFYRICSALDLDCEEIREKKEGIQDIEKLTTEVRQKSHTDIIEKCGSMRVLDMRKPIDLSDIYTDVFILENITGSQRAELDQLNKNFNPDSDDFDRHGLARREKRVSGINIVNKLSKLVILGKPGSGKTTFLKYICLNCIAGKYHSKRIPIFISLKEYSEIEGKPSLIKYIQSKFKKLSVDKKEILELLNYGRCIVVLDGLDEVSEEENTRVINEIKEFSLTFSLSSNIKEYLIEHSNKRLNLENSIKNRINKRDLIRRRINDYIPSYYTTLKKYLLKDNVYDSNYLSQQINLITGLSVDKSERKYQEKYRRIQKEIKHALDSLEKIKKDIITEYLGNKSEKIHLFFSQDKDTINALYKNKKLILYLLQEESLIINHLSDWLTKIEKNIQNNKNNLENEFPDLTRSKKFRQEFLSRQFPGSFYETHFIITCRIASLDYTFQDFTEVEIADFNDKQIKTFVHKWFSKNDPIKEQKFLQQLSINQGVKELANSPLLLTLLCLVFGELGNFPNNRSDLYSEGIKVLLEKWDVKRNIYRDQVYKQLTNSRKLDLLSQVAFSTFLRKDYFFHQKEVEKSISNYIKNLPEASTSLESLRVDSEAILKSIEAQHGLLIERARSIYSFSHLTFQEYFTARKITDTSTPKKLEIYLKDLAGHIFEKRWREVFLLAISLLSEADFLVQQMKHIIDLSIAEDLKLQNILLWAHNRTKSLNAFENYHCIRIYYLSLLSIEFGIHYHNTNFYIKNLTNSIQNTSLIDLIHQSFNLDLNLSKSYQKPRKNRNDYELAILLANCSEEILKFHFNSDWINIIKNNLPHPKNRFQFDNWWKSNQQSWSNNLDIYFNEYSSSITDFSINEDQILCLKNYFIASNFFLECIQTNCVIQRDFRDHIEKHLFLPMIEINDIILIG